jgi:thiosulfate dehydrogenase (quinone) large subunit
MGRERLQGSVPAAALLPLRFFLGFTFVYAGLDKLLDPAFLDPASPSSINVQLEAFTHVSPLAPLIEMVALPAPTAIGVLMALGEVAVGLGALTGILYRLSALGGAFISLTLLLTASWTVRPFYLGNDLPYLAGWITLAAAGHGGVLELDSWLARRLARRRGGQGKAGKAAAKDEEASPGRRLLLGALILGGATLILATLASGLRWLIPASPSSGGLGTPATTPEPGISSSPAASLPAATPVASGGASSTASGPTIANVSDLAQTTAIGFTDPNSGDPAALIKLTDGTFVAYDLICTHAGCAVTNWNSKLQYLVCPCHGAEFDAAHGARVVAGPAPRPLPEIPLVIDPQTGAITVAA